MGMEARATRDRGLFRGLSEVTFAVVQVFVGLLVVIAVCRVVMVHADSTRGSAIGARLGDRRRTIPGPRGSLLDRNGRPLARSVFSYDVHVECWGDGNLPDELAERVIAVFELHGPIGSRRRAELTRLFRLPEPARRVDLAARARRRARAGRRTHPSVWRYYWKRRLARGVRSAAILRALRELSKERIGGCRFRFDFEEAWARVYPLGAAGGHVIGMIAEGANGELNRTGLEALPVLDPGRGARWQIQRDGRGVQYANLEDKLVLASDIGLATVQTTLDSELQIAAHESLARAVAAAGARWGMLALADLASGDLLALVGSPSFDPSRRKKGDSYFPITHQALFVPGSVIKPLLISLALDAGVVRPDQEIACRGRPGERIWRLAPGRRITDDHYVGDARLDRLLIESSNIGAVRVGLLGGRRLHLQLLERFRLGDPPRLGLPLAMTRSHGRVVPMPGNVPLRRLRNPSAYGPKDYPVYTGPSLSFGYQLNIYPLTFLSAFAAVATGRLLRLHLVRSIRDAAGVAYALPTAGPGPRIISEHTVQWMRKTLARVVTDEKGTARRVSGPGVDGVIAGKTGTSFLARRGERINTASFIAFAPADRPRWICLAVLRKRDVRKFYGGKFAAPPVVEVLQHQMRLAQNRARADRAIVMVERDQETPARRTPARRVQGQGGR